MTDGARTVADAPLRAGDRLREIGRLLPPQLFTLSVVLPLITLAALYLPTIERLATGFWNKEDGSYSPIVLIAAIGLSIRACSVQHPVRPGVRRSAAMIGTAVFVIGLLTLILGRILGNMTIEFGSIILTAPGLLIALAGWRALRAQGYAIATLAVSVPLPGSLIVAVTFPLKMAVSRAAEVLLRLVGVPVSREGIMLDIGDYRLLVVDACSGLQSLFSLVAAALIYLALVGHRSVLHSTILLASIVPIAFACNVVRVVVLALVTYTMGDRAGQGFIHGFAGVLMFVCAFAGLMLVDGVAGRLTAKRSAR